MLDRHIILRVSLPQDGGRSSPRIDIHVEIGTGERISRRVEAIRDRLTKRF